MFASVTFSIFGSSSSFGSGAAAASDKQTPLKLLRESSHSQSRHQGILTHDILSKCLSYLQPEDVVHSEKVCKSWNKWINHQDQRVWRMQCLIRKIEVQGMIVLTPSALDFLGAYNSENIGDENGGHKKFDLSVLSIIANYSEPYFPLGIFKKQFVASIGFGKELWNRYFGDIGQVPPLPPGIYKILKSPCPFFPQKTVEETHRLVLIPQTLNGKALTLNRIGEMVQAPKEGNDAEYGHTTFTDDVHGNIGDTPFEASHWVLMTNEILDGTERMGDAKQRDLIATKAHYQMPKVAQAVVCIFTQYVSNGSGFAYHTRCQEGDKSGFKAIVVGGMTPKSLRVYYDHKMGLPNIGVCAVRQF